MGNLRARVRQAKARVRQRLPDWDQWDALYLPVRIILVLAAGGMILTALFVPGGTGIAIGLVVGFVLSGRVRPFISVAEPFGELGRAAAPLLLPLLLLVVIGMIQVPLLGQVAIDLTIVLLAWHAIVRPDLEQLAERAPPGTGTREHRYRRVAKALALPLLAAAVALGVGVWLRRHVDQFETRGGASSFLLLLTLILWSFAIALRLLSFGTSWLRLVVGVVLGLAVLRLAMAAGILPLGTWLDHEVPWLGPAELAATAVVVVLIELALESIEWAGHLHGPKREFVHGAASLGLGMALLATATAGGAALAGLIETSDPGGDRTKSAIEHLMAPAVDENRATDGTGRDIAARYFPVLAFTDAERWVPQSVDSYLAQGQLKGPTLEKPWRQGRPLPPSCRDLAPSPCFKLTINCAQRGRDECAPPHPHEHGDIQRGGAVYVRVLRRGRLPRDGSGDVFVDRGPYRDRLQILVQFWFFYLYDRWTSPLLAGRLVQEHEGDWEAVTLGLADRSTPLFLAYSAHCGGHWKPWDQVEKADRAQQHPLVAVATGSQANYPKADTHQPPDWTSCANLPSGATSLLTYALNVRDTTAYDWEWYPSKLIPVDAKTQPMSFPGRWGEDERISLTNFKRHPFDPGVAPLTPTFQPLWRQPVMTVFCGRYEKRDCETPAATR